MTQGNRGRNLRKYTVGLASSLVSLLAIVACSSESDDKTIDSNGCSVKGDKLECDDGTSYNLADLKGAKGDDGENGSKGTDGENGTDGSKGTDGENGIDGSKGNDGENGIDGSKGDDGENGEPGSPGIPGSSGKSLIRLATVPLGAEVTGAFLTEEGTLFFNVQHPSGANNEVDAEGKTINRGTVGYLDGVNINQLPTDLISVPVPQSDLERETVQTAYGRYRVLAQTGDTFGGTLPQGIGNVLDAGGTDVVISINDPDFNGYVSTGAGEGYLFTNWEAIPGGMSRVKLKTENGKLVVDETTATDNQMIDFGRYGTIANCFGSMTPWGTPLTSEEWGNMGDSTQNWNNPSNTSSQDAMANYIDFGSTAASASVFPNTYRYHYIVEISEPQSTTPVPISRFALGRFEHENAIVMPDQKTVYLSQDDSRGVLFKFIADKAGDLSAGTLYAASLAQDSGSNEPLTTGFNLEWIELAHGDDETIEGWISDYDNVNFSHFVAGQSSYLTDADAAAWAAGEANYPSIENGGGQITAGQPMDNRIVFLESRKAARALQATAEWQKFEGIYINQKRAEEAIEGTDLIAGEDVRDAYVYFAISDLDGGMVDTVGDIQLSRRVKDCGGVYRMKLEANYDVTRIEPVVMGATQRLGVSGSMACNVDSLAQPDNVIVMDDGRIIIGEDGSQTNNTLWLYDPGKR